MKIVITGPKCSGKSTIGEQLAGHLRLPFLETDQLIEEIYTEQRGLSRSFYEIFQEVGEEQFREYEAQAAERTREMDWCVISTGGSLFLNPDLRRCLRDNSIITFLKASPEDLWGRLQNFPKSKYLKGSDPENSFQKHVDFVTEVTEPFADIVAEVPENKDIVPEIVDKLGEELAIRSNAPNTLGEIIRVTTFGESHGSAVGAVLDGIAPGIDIDADFIQKELDRRRPGQSDVSTSRDEKDQVEILSGVFEGKTTGTPIALLVRNEDKDSSKYDQFREIFRPGHADLTFFEKYGHRDHRGGGRSSGRETVGRVAGGAIAKQILEAEGVKIVAYAREIGGVKAHTFDLSAIEKNAVRSPDPEAAEQMETVILNAKREGDSVGGAVDIRVTGVPAGLGDPVFSKLDARLAGALCSLGAVKGVEIGDGFRCASMKASEFNDEMRGGEFLTNHAGGILGGISTGQEITLRVAIKPTPSISQPQQTCDAYGHDHDIQIEGRHDPCIVPRIIPVVESMVSLVILDAWEIQKRLTD